MRLAVVASFVAILLIHSSCAPGARADAAADLAAGRERLQAGELDAALPLLQSAAEAMPQSVEAQLALADCQLRFGQLDEALASYQRVIALNADHAAAKRMFAALTGQKKSAERQLATAQALVDVGDFAAAADLLARLTFKPGQDVQRGAARLLLAEAHLWSNNTAPALAEALRIIQGDENADHVKQARVIAALALAAQAQPHSQKAAQFIADIVKAGELNEPWIDRANAAMTLIELSKLRDKAEVSQALRGDLASLPGGPFQRAAIERACRVLFAEAQAKIGQARGDEALAILWPMFSGGDAPQAAAVLKPLEISGGWLMNETADRQQRYAAVRLLGQVGKVEFDQQGSASTLLGYWLASEVLRQSRAIDAQFDAVNETIGESLSLIGQIAELSRPVAGRKPGDALSPADDMQRAMALQLVGAISNPDQQMLLVQQLLQHISRYQAAGDLESGLALFATVDPAAEGIKAALAPELLLLPPGEAHKCLLLALAQHYAQLGGEQFHKTSLAAIKAAPAINRFDLAALTFYGRLAKSYPTDPAATTAADAVIDRYAAAGQWDVAAGAIAIFANGAGESAGEWAVVRLRTRQAMSAEDKLLAARQALGKELSDPMKSALATAVEKFAAAPIKANRGAVIAIVSPLVDRYAALHRADLAESVIAATAGDDAASPLADWALWMRIELLHRRAVQELGIAAAASEDPATLAVQESHSSELKLLGTLLADHADSDYAEPSVRRVEAIAAAYLEAKAFAAASGVLTEFLMAHENLAAAERLEYRVVETALARAAHAFEQRANKQKPPAAVAAEHGAAIEAIAAFLKARPVGEYSAAAEDALFGLVRIYGEVEAWPAAREVLAQFAAAIPEYRWPSHLKLLEAATYLGELDGAYGLSLLSPLPTTPGQPTTSPTDPSALAVLQPPSLDAADAGGAGFGPPPVSQPSVFAIPGALPPQPSEASLAMIREMQQRQYERIAMLEMPAGGVRMPAAPGDDAATVVVQGVLLSSAEMKRQDAAADLAYAILIELAKSQSPAELAAAQTARTQIVWMFSFFEERLRADRAIALIQKYLADHPSDPERVALAYRALADKIVWVRQPKSGTLVDNAWLQERHAAFDEARREIAAFVTANAGKPQWANAARLLAVESYEQEANLAAGISPQRAGGLLAQGAQALLALPEAAPDHPTAQEVPQRMWSIADRLGGLAQNEQAVDVLRQITRRFPTHDLAQQALLRIAQLYAANLANPLQAVETYQEYLNRGDGDASVPTEIFNLAAQLAGQKRYLEALHVYGVFVDSFPADARAADALHAIGRTHQANEAWEEAIHAYDRVVAEYAASPIVPQAKLDVAECRINLGHWNDARKLYEEYVAKYSGHGQEGTAQQRIEVLKKLDRYQSLLTDGEIDRNKDDAQFQIGRTVLAELANPVKAVEEFRKVVKNFGKSDVADDAQLEIGRTLLSLDRLDEGRLELLKLPAAYPNSPLADDALFAVGQSYEQQAQQLAGITVEKAREQSYVMGQRDAYWRFNRSVSENDQRSSETRRELLMKGDEAGLAINEANIASRGGNVIVGQLFCEVTQAELEAETETALQIANRQDRIHDAYRQAVATYVNSANDYPLGDKTDQSLLRIAQILETELKDRDAAMQTYQKIVALFPGTPVAEDAAWKVTEFHVEEGKYVQAVEAYKTFIRNYPASPRVADAQFGLAEALEQLDRWVDAMDAYEVFRQKFANHPKVNLATEQISWIKTYRK